MGLCWLLWGLDVRLRVGVVVCMSEPVWIRYRSQEIRAVMKLHRYNDGQASVLDVGNLGLGLPMNKL